MIVKRKLKKKDSVVLVCILKSKRDLDILLKEHWYRIPVSHSPINQFDYLAFYEPLSNPQGKLIRYYTKVKSCKTLKRNQLLPDEKKHPRAEEPYLRIGIGNIMKLKSPIKNTAPRRISFGFTTHKQLRSAKDILEVYDIFPMEKIIGEKLKDGGIQAIPQKVISVTAKGKSKRFRLDFAVYCRDGKIAIECDNKKAHSSPVQKSKDKEKDAFLKKDGWKVLRLQEKEVIENVEACIKRIRKIVQKLGGQPRRRRRV